MDGRMRLCMFLRAQAFVCGVICFLFFVLIIFFRREYYEFISGIRVSSWFECWGVGIWKINNGNYCLMCVFDFKFVFLCEKEIYYV